MISLLSTLTAPREGLKIFFCKFQASRHCFCRQQGCDCETVKEPIAFGRMWTSPNCTFLFMNVCLSFPSELFSHHVWQMCVWTCRCSGVCASVRDSVDAVQGDTHMVFSYLFYSLLLCNPDQCLTICPALWLPVITSYPPLSSLPSPTGTLSPVITPHTHTQNTGAQPRSSPWFLTDKWCPESVKSCGS